MSERIQIHSMYFRLAAKQADRYKATLPEIRELEQDPKLLISDLSIRLEHLYEQQKHCAVICVTFSGMALEAFFFDYAASAMSDSFVKEHLDKLDLKSKYLVYPRLVCGKGPDKTGATYAALEKLVKLRNALVHFKSIAIHPNLSKASEASDELDQRLHAGVAEAPAAVLAVMDELDKLHEGRAAFRLSMEGSDEA